MSSTMGETKLSTPIEEPSSFINQRGRDLFNNVALLSLLFIAYSTVRSSTADEFTRAMVNATDLLRIQDTIGLPSELSFQQAVIRQTAFLRAANIYYIAVHFPLTAGFMIWVWRHHRWQFTRVRNTLIAVTGMGLVMHVAYPLAPPRMVEGFVDTAAWLGPNPYDLAVSTAANQIAAMPSLHVGWALLVAISTIWILNTRWRWLALAHPTITAAVVVLTANHYWSDAIVAAVLVFAGWLAFSPNLRLRRKGTQEDLTQLVSQ